MTPIDEHDKELLIAIGQGIRKLRKDRTVKSIELAKEVGISRNALGLMESGRVYFKFSALLKILRFFEISVQVFFKDLNKGS